MKKIQPLLAGLLSLSMLFSFLTFTAFAEPPGNTDDLLLTTTAIPDENFRSYLPELPGLIDEDGYFHKEVAEQVTEISVYNKGINMLAGIEYFTNLESLSCDGNNLAELDLAHNPLLEDLNCFDNHLTELDLENNRKLGAPQFSPQAVTRNAQKTETDWRWNLSNNMDFMDFYAKTELGNNLHGKLAHVENGGRFTSSEDDLPPAYIYYYLTGYEPPKQDPRGAPPPQPLRWRLL